MQQRHADTAALHTHSTQPKLESLTRVHAACPAMRSMRHLQVHAPRALEFCVHKEHSFRQVHTSQGSLGCDVVVVRHPLFRIVPGVEASFTIY